MSESGIVLRQISELDELMRWRREVIENVFGVEPSRELMSANRNYYLQNVPSGRHIAFVASVEGEDIGCGALCFSEELPSPDNSTGKCGYLMNIYVRKPYRHHGVGAAIVKRLVDEAVMRECGKIYLETTDEGRAVYASLGFREMPDMMKLT